MYFVSTNTEQSCNNKRIATKYHTFKHKTSIGLCLPDWTALTTGFARVGKFSARATPRSILPHPMGCKVMLQLCPSGRATTVSLFQPTCTHKAWLFWGIATLSNTVAEVLGSKTEKASAHKPKISTGHPFFPEKLRWTPEQGRLSLLHPWRSQKNICEYILPPSSLDF